MKTYDIPTEFTFHGVFKVKARSKAEAVEHVTLHCGMVMGSRGVHSSLPDDDVDWDFPIHPEKTVLTPNDKAQLRGEAE